MLIFFRTWNSVSSRVAGQIKEMFQDRNVHFAILEDDGYKPDDVISPCSYYHKMPSDREKRQLFYNCLKLPMYWGVLPDDGRGKIVGHNRIRGRIIFGNSSGYEDTVKDVIWYDPDGTTCRIDHFDQYGEAFVRDDIIDDKLVRKAWYDDDREIMSIAGDTVVLSEDGQATRFFTTLASFYKSYIEDVSVYVKTDKAFFVFTSPEDGIESYGLPSISITRIVYDAICASGSENARLYRYYLSELPTRSPGRNIFILTASDKIEGLEALITRLPEYEFNIAAYTLVSSKLSAMENYANVHVYPGVTNDKVNQLYDNCNIYLDINYYGQPGNAVLDAMIRGIPVMAFDDTVHERNITMKECIVPAGDVDELIRIIKSAFDSDNYDRLVRRQQEILIDAANLVFK